MAISDGSFFIANSSLFGQEKIDTIRVMKKDLPSASDIFDWTFSAAMFDYDGTLTERTFSSVSPPELCEVVQNLCGKIPLALCSARELHQTVKKLEVLLGDRFLELQKYWTIFTENGAAGYSFDGSDWMEFHRVLWPEGVIAHEAFYEKLNHFFAQKVDYISNHKSCFILRPKKYDSLNSDELLTVCNELEKDGYKFLKTISVNNFITLGNSSMGIIFYNTKADKDQAIEIFGKRLGLQSPYREILAVGDRPGKGGNDEAFLSGRFGIPFTVGEEIEKDSPLGVFDAAGKRLTGPLATAFLLHHLKFI